MKLSPLASLLLFAAGWLQLACCNVRFALSKLPGFASQRGHYLACAREDAAQFRRLIAIWAERTLNAC